MTGDSSHPFLCALECDDHFSWQKFLVANIETTLILRPTIATNTSKCVMVMEDYKTYTITWCVTNVSATVNKELSFS